MHMFSCIHMLSSHDPHVFGNMWPGLALSRMSISNTLKFQSHAGHVASLGCSYYGSKAAGCAAEMIGATTVLTHSSRGHRGVIWNGYGNTALPHSAVSRGAVRVRSGFDSKRRRCKQRSDVADPRLESTLSVEPDRAGHCVGGMRDGFGGLSRRVAFGRYEPLNRL